ncbi:hypothetical protein [Clostridium sp.]|jgi:hypothetical protein|uniref:hypothetical protein n=1 Tax=Clostridium TaxID=1485 RepID=UPI002901A8DB|nr:hypothetical protein [Clostridium sp.]MDU2680149.1 hypothetical protein [Clostridium sp.]
MKNEIDVLEAKRIYEEVLKQFNLTVVEGIKVVSENKEKLKEKLIYIGENNIL